MGKSGQKPPQRPPTTLESQDRILNQRLQDDERRGGLSLSELARIANRPRAGREPAQS